MAEIKAVIKKLDPEDKETLAEKQQEIEEVKQKMLKLKDDKISEAKQILEAKKEKLNQEKKDFFLNIKQGGIRSNINNQSPFVGSEPNKSGS